MTDLSASVLNFSLIIPTCNRSGSLQRLLHSVDVLVIPPGSNAEVIAVDNGSVDDTPRLLAQRTQAGRGTVSRANRSS